MDVARAFRQALAVFDQDGLVTSLPQLTGSKEQVKKTES
jgi:hypothetical protein